MKCSVANVGTASSVVGQVQWKAESKTLRFACRRCIREHSQEQHLRRIRKEEFEEIEDEL